MTQSEHREKAEHFKRLLSPYFGPQLHRSLLQIVTTIGPFLFLWYLSYRSLEVGYWLTLLLSIPTAGFLLRIFLIQHDLGHGSFLRNQRLANLVGFWLGVATLTPYRYWRRTHAYHHAHCGDLNFREFGDIRTRTLAEYRAMTPRQRFAYRLYRNPLVLFCIGAPFHFLVKHRYPWNTPRAWKHEWADVWRTNLALVGILALAHFTIGLGAFLAVHLPVLVLTASAGVWFFYVQHQFEDGYWRWHEDWNFFDAALHGSTHLVLPRPIQWISANIGLHHVHHLSARIPNYRLEECLNANPELQRAKQITIRDGMNSLLLSLWDEDKHQLISFRTAHQRIRQPELAI